MKPFQQYLLLILAILGGLHLFSGRANAQFNETFEVGINGGYIVNGWVLRSQNSGDLSTFALTGRQANNAYRGLVFYNVSGQIKQWLISPPITVTAGLNDFFSFYARKGSNSSSQSLHEAILFLAPNGGSNFSDFTVDLNPSGNAPLDGNYRQQSADLSAYVGQTVRVAIITNAVGVPAGRAVAIDLDDIISGPAIPYDCSAVPSITSYGRITSSSILANWTPTPNALSYEVYVAQPNVQISGPVRTLGTVPNPTGTITLATGARDMYVRATCPGGSLSAWSRNQVINNTFCHPVSNLQTSGAPNVEVEVSFDPNIFVIEHQIILAPNGGPGVDIFNTPDVTTTGTSIGFSSNNILPNVPVDVYARTLCSDNRLGEWTGPSTYTYEPCTNAPVNPFLTTSIIGQPVLRFTRAFDASSTDLIAVAVGTIPQPNAPVTINTPSQGVGNVQNTILLTPLPPGQNFDLYIRSVCPSGSTSSLVGPITYAAPSCTAPSNVAAANGLVGALNVTFNGVSGVQQYEVRAQLAGTVAPTLSSPALYTSTSTSIDVSTGLTSGTAYDFYVRTRCSNYGLSQWSTPATATYNPICTAVVSNVSVNNTTGLITWSATGNPTSYNLYLVAPGATVTPGVAPTAIVTSTQASISAIAPINGTYDLYVEAVCGANVPAALVGPTTFTACTGSCVQGQCASSNVVPSASQSAPGNPVPDVLSASILPGDYFVISSLEAGRTYNFASNIPTDFFTVREGNLSSTVVASGTGSTSFVSGSGNDLYVSLFTNEQCGTSSVVPRVVVVNCADCLFDVAPLPSDACSGVAIGTVDGTAAGIFVPILDANDDIVCAIKTSANLGVVNAQVYGHSGPLRISNQAYADRNITINPAITLLPGETAEVKLYFTDAEVQALILSGAISSANAIGISKVSNTSCSATYPGGGILIPATGTAYGANAWEYTFTVSDFSEFFASSQSAPLPVELSSFEAFAKTDGNVLEWTTASEIDVDRFEIERTDGRAEFSLIGSVAASGTTAAAREYRYTDKRPMATSYYRLKMLDLDGSYEYSNVVVVEADQLASSTTLKVSPNPNNGEFSVAFSERLAPSVLVVTDALGRVLLRQSISAGETEYEFDLNYLASGSYAIRFIGVEADHATSFIVR